MNIIFGGILIFLFVFAILFLVNEIRKSRHKDKVHKQIEQHEQHKSQCGETIEIEWKCGCKNEDLSNLTYDELLSLPQWKDKRHSILERDGYRCRYCGSNGLLNVHHKYYLKYPNNKMVEPWEYDDDALITLCEECHKKSHQKKKIKVYYTKYKV